MKKVTNNRGHIIKINDTVITPKSTAYIELTEAAENWLKGFDGVIIEDAAKQDAAQQDAAQQAQEFKDSDVAETPRRTRGRAKKQESEIEPA